MVAHETGTRLGKESADTTIKEHHDPPPNFTEKLAQSSPLHNHADVQIVSIVAPLTSSVRFEKVLQMGYRRALFEVYKLKSKSAARIRSESKSQRGGHPRIDKTSDIAVRVGQIHQCNQRRNNCDGTGIVHAMDYSRRVGSYHAFQIIPSLIPAPFFAFSLPSGSCTLRP